MDKRTKVTRELQYRILQRGTTIESVKAESHCTGNKYPVPAPEDVLIRKFIKLVQDYGLENNTGSYTARNVLGRLEMLETEHKAIDFKPLQECFRTGNYHVSHGYQGNVLHQLRSEFNHLRTVLTVILDKGGYSALQTVVE